MIQGTKQQELKSPLLQHPPADIATFEQHLNGKKYKGRIGGAYERLLELPVPMVLGSHVAGGGSTY